MPKKPITGDPLNSRDNLIATKAIESARFLPLTPRVNILGDLLESLQKHAGYQEGNWENPAPDGDRDTFYTFVYDWRRDNVQIAQQLLCCFHIATNEREKYEYQTTSAFS